MTSHLTRSERRQAHLIKPLTRAARAVRDLWTVVGVLLLINAAAPALLSAFGVNP